MYFLSTTKTLIIVIQKYNRGSEVIKIIIRRHLEIKLEWNAL